MNEESRNEEIISNEGRGEIVILAGQDFQESENTADDYPDNNFTLTSTTSTNNGNDLNESVEVPISVQSTNVEIENENSQNQAVPEMVDPNNVQLPTSNGQISTNDGIILIFDSQVSSEDQQEILQLNSNVNNSSVVNGIDSELQVVPNSMTMSNENLSGQSVIVESTNESSLLTTQPQTVPSVKNHQEMVIPSWEMENVKSTNDESGMSLLSSVASAKETLNSENIINNNSNTECCEQNILLENSESAMELVGEKQSEIMTEPRMMAFDSNTGEFVEFSAINESVHDGQVTYIFQNAEGEETSYQIVTNEQLREMQSNEIVEEEDEIEISVQNESVVNEQYVLGTEVEGKELLLHLASTQDSVQPEETHEPEIVQVNENENKNYQEFVTASGPIRIVGIPEEGNEEDERDALAEAEVHVMAEEEQHEQTQPQVIDLGSASSLISSDNVQALLQILQALPFQGQGQTVQIVLQGAQEGDAESPMVEQEANIFQLSTSNLDEMQIGDSREVVQLMSMSPTSKRLSTASKRRTMDTAVQATLDQVRRGPGYKIRAINDQMDLIQMDPNTSRNVYAQRRIQQRQSTTPRRTLVRASTSNFYYNLPTSDGEDSTGDNQAGVSYYAIMDYMSEVDGYSSAQETQFDGPGSEFMEDYLELQQDGDVVNGRNLLSSTLDEKEVPSPYPRRKGKYKVLAVSQPGSSIDLPEAGVNSQSNVTLPARTYEQVTLDGRSLAEYTNDELDPLSRPPRYTRGLRTLPRRMIYRCAYCDYESRDKLLVTQHCHVEHPENSVRVLTLIPECSRRQCPYCKQKFNYAEFFQHMRYAHNDVHPYKCYYCDFQGRDRNQVKHHICKKHAKPTRIINLMRDGSEVMTVGGGVVDGKRKIMAVSEGEDSVYEYLTEDEEDGEWEDGVKRNLTCPECKKSFKSLKYLKTHIKMHRPHRFQCGYCDYIATLEHQILKHSLRKHGTAEPRVISKELEPEKNPLISRDIDSVVRRVFSMSLRQPRDEDPMTWARKWTCPHCDYTCQFGASFRRHIRMHANLLPYKCNYCSFKGREKYYVRRHIARMHRGLPEIVVDNTAENRAGDTSSDEDYQEKGLRRRRKRKIKNVLKAVVPVGTPTPPDVHIVVKKEVVGRNEKEDGFEGEDVGDGMVGGFDAELSGNDGYSRLSTSLDDKLVSECYGSREGENIVCKICNVKIHSRAFQKHVRKHRRGNLFGCGYCDYTACERSKVRVHIAFHHPSMPFKVLVDGKEKIQHFQCPICQQQLVAGDETLLREHFYVHYDFKPFQCRLCETRAASRDMVLAHGTVEHGEVVQVDVLEEAPPDGLEDTIQQFLHEIDVTDDVQVVGISADPVVIVDETVTPTPPVKRKRGRPPKIDKGLPTSAGRFECPVCHSTMHRHAATVRRHLYNHFEYKPYICGYCGHRAFTDNEVRQHNATHGKVPSKVTISDERMPTELENLLSTVNEELRAPGSNKFPSASDPNSLVTSEGRRWHDSLSKGVCPWCEEFVGHFRPTAYRHLKTHFQCRPYRCGHCGHRGSERNEIKLHSTAVHPADAVAVVGPSIKMVEIEQGLKRYLQGRPSVMEKIREEEEEGGEEGESVVTELSNGASGVGESAEAVKELVASELVSGKTTQITEIEQSVVLQEENKKNYPLDSEILEVSDCGATLLVRNFRSDNDASSESGNSMDVTAKPTELVEENVDVRVPVDLLEDVCYLLQLSCLPQDVPLTRRKLNWHRCTQCKRKFRKAVTLREHVASEHQTEGTCYNCCYCNYWNCDKLFVKNHIESCHPGRRILMKERIFLKQRSILKRNSENVENDDGKKLRTDMDSLTLIESTSTDLPTKRKRGRPPKMATDFGGDDAKEINVILQVDSTSIKTTVKRGRPRKIQPTITMPPEENDSSKMTVVQVDTVDQDKLTTVTVKCSSPSSPDAVRLRKFALRGEAPVDPSELIGSSCVVKSVDERNQSVGNVELELESLEECDENLPRVLHILKLQ